MPRDGVSQARTQHHEFVLALAVRRAHRAPHGAIKPPQLALGAGVHIAHAADDAVCLVVQIKTVRHEFFQLDLRRSLRASTVAVAVVPPVVPASAAIRSAPAFTRTARPATALTRSAGGTAFPSLLLFRHALNLSFSRQAG